MFMAFLGKINAYLMLSFYMFVLYSLSFSFLPPEFILENPTIALIPGMIPMFYSMMLLILIFCSLTFKVKKP